MANKRKNRFKGSWFSINTPATNIITLETHLNGKEKIFTGQEKKETRHDPSTYDDGSKTVDWRGGFECLTVEQNEKKKKKKKKEKKRRCL